MANAVLTSILDHIVHLTSPGTLHASVDTFRRLGFTVSPGGTHADGLTANALVIFADGTYLELLHFTSMPPPESTHPWARKLPGWIDFAFLGTGGVPSIAETINARAEKEGSGVRYEETRGGRTREDGKVLQWIISAEAVRRGGLPFFCGDVTPREWRVPLESSNVEHANGATGIAHVRLLVEREELAFFAKQMTSVVGAAPSSSTRTEMVWDLEEQPSGVGSGATQLIVSAANDDEERAYLRDHGRGVYEVAFYVPEHKSETSEGNRVVWRVVKARI